ncbi:metalloregulator ArsR/SmtB family transcription factor [bacterium]|nr:metalloregulator ArsR/SmtB family transcription factor [bacterium]
MRKEIKILKALANEKRLEILKLLERHNDLNVGEIAQQIHLHFKSTSKHLQKLADAGLVERRRDGLFVSNRNSKLVARLLSTIRNFI